MTRAPQQMREKLGFEFGNWPASCSSKNAFVFTNEGNSVKQRRKGSATGSCRRYGLSQRKFSVNDLQVQENCSDEPISGRGGCRFSDTGEKVQVTKLRAIMAKAVFNPKKMKIITVVSFIRKHDADITGVWILNP